MKPFTYERTTTVDQALAAIGKHSSAMFLGGGTNLIDLMKMGVEQPAHLVDVTRLPLATIEDYQGGLRIGALVSNRDLASDRRVRERYPVLSQALVSGASPQLRNAATTGGNLLQSTRCYYYYDPSFAQCNKRVPGSGCAAITGYNRIHAILGASDQCIAVNPSDMGVALTALEAMVQVKGSGGARSMPIADFFRLRQYYADRYRI